MKAAAVFIVIKRLLKWIALFLLAGVVLISFITAYKEYQNNQLNKPRLITEYADLKLGASQEHVKYVLGDPPEFLVSENKEPETLKGTGFRQVYKNDKIEGHLISQSDVWFYDYQNHLISVSFDKPGGIIAEIACITSANFSCPEIFGIRDGSGEEDVLKSLGEPDSEVTKDSVKVMRYNRYNVTLHLKKKKVYYLTVTALPQ